MQPPLRRGVSPVRKARFPPCYPACPAPPTPHGGGAPGCDRLEPDTGGGLLHWPGILRDEQGRTRLHRLFVNTTRPWAALGARSRHRPKGSVRKTCPGRTEGGVAASSDRIISRLRHSPLPAEVKTRFLGLYEQFWEATPPPSSGSGKRAVTRLKLQ